MLEEQGCKCGTVCNSWYKWRRGDPVVQRRCSKAEKIEFPKLYLISDYVRTDVSIFFFKNCKLEDEMNRFGRDIVKLGKNRRSDFVIILLLFVEYE